MAEYWQSSFLRVYGLRQSQGPFTRKKRMRPMSSYLDRKSFVNKGFIKGFRRIFLWDMAGSSERARLLHLACLGIQSQCVIWFILPTHGGSHMIKVLGVHMFGDTLSVRHHY